MELVQKDERPSGRQAAARNLSAILVAKASAKCWASNWMLLRPNFERITGQQLRPGMKVLLKVYAQFHEAYGFSWIVTDIDPTYTLGDMARKRLEIISRLKEEGVFDMQRELPLPLFCLRIAVISSQTAAGYGDFAAQLADSQFAFHTQLFPAIMQGEQVEQSVISALDRINDRIDDFDCVVIIRGGGATSDLSGFDTLLLAESVANFPIPVITGIGHDRDESILDMVSHRQVKTPTAAAAFLIDHAQALLDALDDAQHTITRQAQQQLATCQAQLAGIAAVIPSLFSVVRTRQEARIDQLFNRMVAMTQQQIATQRERVGALRQRLPLITTQQFAVAKHQLELCDEKLKMLDPQLLLRRGYSITLKDGHAVRDPQTLSPGDEIVTRLEKGTIHSVVTPPHSV